MGFRIELDGIAHEVEIVALRPLRLRVDGVECVASKGEGEDVEVDGRTLRVARAYVGARQHLRVAGRTFEATLIDPRDAVAASGGGLDHVRAPMPGAVIHLHKRPGDTVARGEPLLTIESMKLQMTLNAPRDGVLASLARGVGEIFEKDEIVAELKPLDGA